MSDYRGQQQLVGVRSELTSLVDEAVDEGEHEGRRAVQVAKRGPEQVPVPQKLVVQLYKSVQNR